jgi:hypothetical protein
MLANGSTAIEGRSGKVKAGRVPDCGDVEPSWSCCSCTVPTKRKPLRSRVLIRRWSWPLSPMAPRAALMRVVSADSETMRPAQTAPIRSSLLTTRSLLRIKYDRMSKTCGSTVINCVPRRSSRRSVSMM